MNYGLKAKTIQKIYSVFACYPQVEQVILYGSRAKGNYKNGSDIDLTLLGGAELNSEIQNQIITELDDLLMPYTIDISIFNEIDDPEFIDQIQRVGIVFYEKSLSCYEQSTPRQAN